MIVSQRGVNAADYADPRATPLLRKMMRGDDKRLRSSVAISDVVGTVNSEQLGHLLMERCGAGVLEGGC